MINIKKIKEFNEERYKGEFKIGKFEFPRIKRIIDVIPSNKRILDIGCYEGTISRLIKEKNNIVVGLDISKNALKKAKRKGIICVLSYAETLPFRDSAIDAVVASEIIEHIFDTSRFLDEINRVLKKGGELILTTPNLASLSNRIRLFLGLQPNYCEVELSECAGHIRFFTVKSLKKLLEKHAFKVEKIKTDALFIPFFGRISKKIATSRILGKLFPSIGNILIFKCKKGPTGESHSSGHLHSWDKKQGNLQSH